MTAEQNLLHTIALPEEICGFRVGGGAHIASQRRATGNMDVDIIGALGIGAYILAELAPSVLESSDTEKLMLKKVNEPPANICAPDAVGLLAVVCCGF